MGSETEPCRGGSDTAYDRRAFVRLAGGATIAVVSAAGVAPRTAAHPICAYHPPENASTPIVSTRNQYRNVIGTTAARKPAVDETDYVTSGDVPGSDTDCPDSLVVFVHGAGVSESEAASTFETVRSALVDEGYDGAFAGFSWDANPSWDTFAETRARAADNGSNLGQFLRDVRDACPGAALHLLGHGIGTTVVLEALGWLSVNDRPSGSDPVTVTSVHSLGAPVSATAPAKAATIIERTVGRFHNYWSREDAVVANRYLGPADPLGTTGGAGPTPVNYADHDVTASVGDDHDAYVDRASRPLTLVAENVRAATGQAPPDDGSGGGGVPPEADPDTLVEAFNQNWERSPIGEYVPGEDPVTLHVVRPDRFGERRRKNARDRSVAATYTVTFADGNVASWTPGTDGTSSIEVYATRRALEYVATADRPVDALQEARHDGILAVTASDAVDRTVTGAATYAVDTRRTVVGAWKRTLGGIRTTVGGLLP